MRSIFRVLGICNFAHCPNFTPILPGVLPNPKAMAQELCSMKGCRPWVKNTAFS